MILFTFILFCSFLFTRMLPYINNSVPLGYDSGLYLYLYKRIDQIPFWDFYQLPDWMIAMYQPGIPLVAKTLLNFFSPESLVLPLVIFFNGLLFLSLFLFARKLWGDRAAFWTLLIFTTSAIQFRFYWYYYLKNIAALSFLFFAFYFLQSSSYWAIPFTILVLYFHQQTAVFMVAVLCLLIAFKKDQRRYLATVLGVSLLAASPYYLSTFNLSLQPLVEPVISSLIPQPLGGSLGASSGTFYSLSEAVMLSLLYLPFGIAGLVSLRLQPKSLPITISFLLSFTVVVFGLFFGRRFIPLMDLFLILLAGFGASVFFQKRLYLRFIYGAALVVFCLVFINKTGVPLIVEDELSEIRKLQEIEANATVLVTNQEYMPWVYGWSDRKTVAPGFGENDIYWTTNQWFEFWKSNNRQTEKELLLKLPQPLYIFKGDRAEPILTDFSGPCFERVNWRTFKFICRE